MTEQQDIQVNRLYNWAAGSSSPPVFANFFLFENREGLNYFKSTDIFEIISVLKEIGVKYFKFIGGPDNVIDNGVLKEALKKCGGPDIEMVINSRGMSLSREDVYDFFRLGVSSFEFDLRGYNEFTSNFGIKKDDSWKNIVNSLKYISQVTDTWIKEKPRIVGNILLTKNNWNQIPNIVRFVANNGGDMFRVSSNPWLENMSERLTATQKNDLLLMKDNLKSICTLYGLKNNFSEEFTYVKLSRKKKGSGTRANVVTGSKGRKKRFKKRYPGMSAQFLDFVVQNDYAPWLCLSLGPGGFYVPLDGENYDVVRPLTITSHIIEKLWSEGLYSKYRINAMKGITNTQFTPFMNIEHQVLKKMLIKQWSRTQQFQPGDLPVLPDLLGEYRKKELKEQETILDKDIKWLEEKLKNINKRIDIYSEDKTRMKNLNKSKMFRMYRALRRLY